MPATRTHRPVRPVRLSSTLLELDRQLRSRPARSGPTNAVERGFAAGVADRLGRGAFTYSDRAALLAAGQRLGLLRSRANLIVALAQNGVRRPTAAPRQPRRWGPAIAVAFAVQAAVVSAGAWAWLA